MVRQQLFIGAALLAGAAIGFFAHPGGDAKQDGAPKDAEPAASSRPIADNGRSATIASLRARVAELEAKLARLESAAKAEPVPEKDASAERRPERNPGADFRAHMEELKKNDPARYAQITNRFAQMRSHQLARQQSKLDFLSSIDVSGMDAAAQKTHYDLQDAIVKVEDLRDRLHQADLSDEERRAVFDEMREKEHELQRLGLAERNNLLFEMARSMGLEGEAVNDAARMVSEIISATESRGFGRPPRGGGPRHRGGR